MAAPGQSAFFAATPQAQRAAIATAAAEVESSAASMTLLSREAGDNPTARAIGGGADEPPVRCARDLMHLEPARVDSPERSGRFRQAATRRSSGAPAPKFFSPRAARELRVRLVLSHLPSRRRCCPPSSVRHALPQSSPRFFSRSRGETGRRVGASGSRRRSCRTRARSWSAASRSAPGAPSRYSSLILSLSSPRVGTV